MSFSPTLTLEEYAVNHLTPCAAPNNWQCPVCYDDYRRTVVVSTHCKHLFHGACLLESLNTPDVQWSNQCPVCRAKLFYLRKTATGVPHPDFPIEVIQQTIALGLEQANRQRGIQVEPFVAAQIEHSMLGALDNQRLLGADQANADHAPLVQLALNAQQTLTDLQQSLVARHAFRDQRRTNAQYWQADSEWRRINARWSAQQELAIRERLRPLVEGAVLLIIHRVPLVPLTFTVFYLIILYKVLLAIASW